MATVTQLGKKAFCGKVWCFSRFSSYSRRLARVKSTQLTSVFLENRSLIKISGQDSAHFLNGLVTNDVDLFHCDAQMEAMYCMMLNVKGRVLYDILIYKMKENLENAQYLLECDSAALTNIIKTFKIYKLRSNVEFVDVSERFSSWVIIHQHALENVEKMSEDSNPLVAVKDPRLNILGVRLVLPKAEEPSKYYSNVDSVLERDDYDAYRVRHGVSEGIKDIEPGVALPLEYNITELHGVSYQKGCYIGQELTARSHHTGIIRKRLMPLKLNIDNNLTQATFDKNASIETTNRKAAGKLKSTYGNLAFGLMRLDSTRNADGLSVLTSDGTSVSVIPHWPLWWKH